MRKFALVPLLLVACGSEEPAPAVEKAWNWKAGGVQAATVLPGGEIFAAVAGAEGASAEGIFLSADGKPTETVALDCAGCGGLVPSQPLVVGGQAFFGSAEPGGPLLRIEPENRRVRELPIENPRNLVTGPLRIDGRYAAAMTNGTQMLVPGGALVEVSDVGMVTEIHRPAGGEAAFLSVRAIAHAFDEVYVYINDSGYLGRWDAADNSFGTIPFPATRIAGGDGFTIAAVGEEGRIELHELQDLEEGVLGPVFGHEVELAVSPQARRIVVGVTSRPFETPAPEGVPAPNTVLVLDGSGEVLGEEKMPGEIRSVSLSPDGGRAVVAHAAGVTAFDLR
ncbi:hypothetical protein [Vulgatibacter sp.]|uniref:hypothetical protein n=1 Tax=Vulgatibacter sp. TaxID=1971226 RepID=UPI003568A8E7